VRQTILLPAALGMAVLASFPAHADFQLGHAGDGDGSAAPQSVARPEPEPAATEPAMTPRFKIARGFGRSIPLRVAAKQIVPAAVTVRFGPGVNPGAVVNWSGNAPWNRVLAAAVRPLGLHITTGARSVLISR